jgi:hypothetical protein
MKTPTQAKPDKTSTVKVFTSGKLNIDGDNTREEAELIYLWLNKLFVTIPELIYREGEIVTTGPDEEFPDEDESDEELEDITSE